MTNLAKNDAEIEVIATCFPVVNEYSQDALAGDVAELQAGTIGGMAAKARILHALLGDAGLGRLMNSGVTESRLIASLLRDLLAA